jgi:CBS domain containing-hemolysin-like protein
VSLLWVTAASLVVAMFFSAAEMAFIAANRLKLRHLAESGNRMAAAYLESFRHPEHILAVAKMGGPIAHVVAASSATFALLPVFGGAAPLIVTVVLTPLMLIFGEIIPKAITREWATELILWLYRPLTWAAVVLMPFVTLSNLIVGSLLRLFGASQLDSRQFVSREELKALLALEPGEADVTTHEAELIGKIFDLGDTTVREVMVPLVDVAMLPEDAPPGEAIRMIHQRGFSRIPIFEERESNVVGVVAAMDILSRGTEAATIGELARQPYFVPETKRIDDLLREMQRHRIHMAIVVDEYGGSTGIVTLEDIVEEIVGEIQDEHDRTPASVERLPDGSYLVAGRTNIDELNEALDWSLPKQDYETVAGLVLATLGRIPRVGEELQIPGYSITVMEADARRIVAVKIAPAPAPAPALA